MVHTNELMLGDWVNYIGAYEDDSGEIVKLWESPISIKVTFITPDAVQYEDEEGCYECLDYELHPIPLTPEILEKNGFEKDPESGELIWTDDDVTEIVWVGTILTIRGEYANAEFATCMFVHQLQHALRLCQIEKEIEL